MRTVCVILEDAELERISLYAVRHGFVKARSRRPNLSQAVRHLVVTALQEARLDDGDKDEGESAQPEE